MPRNLRNIKDEESNFIKDLISRSKKPELLATVPQLVIELDDGGMGSIRLDIDESNIYGSELIGVEYIDEDETPVSIVLNLNRQGKLFELDFFKADFSKLLKYPTIDNIILSSI